MIRRPSPSPQRLHRLAIVPLAVVLLAGCTSAPPAASGAGSASPTPSLTAAEQTPSAPRLHPDGTAEDNLPLFDEVVQQIWAGEQRAEGRAYIDGLVAAGFDKSAMQVTQDQTTQGNPAESIQFSVRWGADECLIGQVGPSTGQAVTQVMPQLAEGRCLIGQTRSIDW